MALKDDVAKLQEAVKELSDKVEALVSPKVEVSVQNDTTTFNQNPVPSEYRNIVNETLNKSFGVIFEPSSDQPGFNLTIVVPDKYSPATQEQKAVLGGIDARPRFISYAEGLNGVKSWCEKVFSSFNPDIKAMITADRIEAM